jgi:hypothetical protein
MYKLKLVPASILFLLLLTCTENADKILSPEELSEKYNLFKTEIISEYGTAKITLERTACYGFCPIYAVAIYESGKVEYFGYQFVEKAGFYTSNISSNSIDDLLNFAVEHGYDNLENEYFYVCDTTDTGEILTYTVSDLPTKITSIVSGGNRKTIKNYYGGPYWLALFERKIDSTVNVSKWVGGE